MKLKRNSNIIIAKSKMTKNQSVLDPLEYRKWVDYIDDNSDVFTWKENSKEGIEILKKINDIPENFKERVLSSLNKIICYSGFNEKKGTYDLYAGFNEKDNWITVNIAREPNLNDLKIFIKMAEHLDALLLLDGTKVINEETLKDFS